MHSVQLRYIDDFIYTIHKAAFGYAGGVAVMVVAQKRVKKTTVHHHTDDLKDNAKGKQCSRC